MSTPVVNALDRSDSSLEGDPRWEIAARVERSFVFSRATQLRSILVYVVRQAILHPDNHVRESEIAYRVLGRRSDFNPVDDNIVRVQMGHLRKKLDLYFATEGKDEEIVITFPRGNYTPVFTSRAAVEEPPAPQPQVTPATPLVKSSAIEPGIAAPVAEPVPPAAVAQSVRPPFAKWIASTAACSLLIGGTIGFLLRSPERSGGSNPTANNPILHRLFTPNATVNVVVADTALVVTQNMLHTDISIAQYLNQNYPNNLLQPTTDPGLRDTLLYLSEHRFTSLNDVDVASRVFDVGAQSGAKSQVRYARYMHPRDFDQGNFVIVGSRRGNPWVSLFESQLSFHFEENPATHVFYFKNQKPQPGEDLVYEPRRGEGGADIEYVDVALLPNLSGTGSVLLLNGFSMGANDAAVKLIFSKEFPPSLKKAVSHLTEHSRIEILLRVYDVDHTDNRSEIVAVRDDPS